MSISSVDQLRELTSSEWPSLKKAEQNSIVEKKKIAELLYINGTKIFDSDCDFVVFGSLARNEFTVGSDLDWTLLIDGQAKLDHQEVVIALKNKFKNSYQPPGYSGTFGGLAFSHDIIHHIGGFDDNNKNTTRRILLLLESSPIPSVNNAVVYKNVIRNVLKRYLNKSFTTGDIQFPRFLLNDVVRYWRLICVDFAAKEWAEREYKWVLRNIKLRFSRKLLFVAGMLMCYSFYESNLKSEIGKNNLLSDDEIEKLINEYVFRTPLDILASFIVQYGLVDIGRELFDHYDYFLSILDDSDKREELGNLNPKKVMENDLFLKLRTAGHKYQDALTKLFFKVDTPLKEFTINFGIF